MLHWKDKALQFQQQSIQLSTRSQQQSSATQFVSHDESASKTVILDQISYSSVERELRAIQAQYSERLRSLISQYTHQLNLSKNFGILGSFYGSIKIPVVYHA